MFFLFFFQKIGFDISCKYAWNVRAYFLKKKKKKKKKKKEEENITSLSSAEYAHEVVKVSQWS